jgi:hypothetical protein
MLFIAWLTSQLLARSSLLLAEHYQLPQYKYRLNSDSVVVIKH